MLLGLLSMLAMAAPAQVCDKATSLGWVATRDGRVFTKWEFATEFALPEHSKTGLTQLAAAFEHEGIALVAVVLPTRPMAVPGALPPGFYAHKKATQSYRSLLSDMASMPGLTVVDGLTVAETHGDDFYFSLDHHWTPAGAQSAARSAAATVLLQDSWDEVKTEPYKTTAGEPVQAVGNMTVQVEKKCGPSKHPKIQYAAWTTEAESGGPGLLDDAPAPPVVALGSSMMRPEWHFAGFLKSELGADVLSVPIGGGHALGAMLAWLRTTDLTEDKPKAVVWEIEAFDTRNVPDRNGAPDFASADVWGQLRAAVHGSCHESAVTQVEVPVAADTSLLSAIDSDGEMRLLLTGSDAAFMDFEVITTYADGFTSTVPMHGYRKVPATGRFFMMFAPDHGTVADVSLRVPPRAVRGRVTAQVCRMDP